MSELKKFAEKLNGRDIGDITPELKEEAKRKGFVIVTGYSDDLMEFDGAIEDEIGCWQGGEAYLNKNGLCNERDSEWEIKSLWYQAMREVGRELMIFPWSYETEIAHEEFFLFEYGDPWCVGIVFELENLAGMPSVADDEIVFAKVRKDARIPKKEEENAGYDIYACFEEESMTIEPHTTKMVPTGIACALHPKWYFQVEERGSTGSRGMKKSAGVIDSGYRGEIFIAITNTNDHPIVISKKKEEGTYPYEKAIAQLILHEVPKMKVVEVSYEDLLKIPSERGTGKLGSSNK